MDYYKVNVCGEYAWITPDSKKTSSLSVAIGFAHNLMANSVTYNKEDILIHHFDWIDTAYTTIDWEYRY